MVSFGEHEEDAFPFTFGCVTTETHLFYTQAADGILGFTRSSPQAAMRPIFEVMKDEGLVESKMFAICLGKNGGYLQIGGYDG